MKVSGLQSYKVLFYTDSCALKGHSNGSSSSNKTQKKDALRIVPQKLLNCLH